MKKLNAPRMNLKRLTELLRDIRIAMLTTADHDGTLRSRPMVTPTPEFTGELWFFTRLSSHKVEEISEHPKVNLSYSDPEKQRYVSISGRAQLVRDRVIMEELWTSALKPWFPRGLEDSDLALLRVDLEEAEYWDASQNKMVQLMDSLSATRPSIKYKRAESKKIKF